ncbi:MAG: hypothetical protein JEZ12_11780 [Desulfobacterium sp.]|nr:hypothetical protein [Desulfobacterium sp.]
MTDELFKFISGKSLMKRWDIGAVELEQLCNRFIEVYSIERNPVETNHGVDEAGPYKVEKLNTDTIIGVQPAMCPTTIERLESAVFLMEDIENLENKYPELSLDAFTKTQARELGKLRRKKEDSETALKAAIKIGRWLETDNTKYKVTKTNLKEFIQNFFPDIYGKTMVNRLWEAIPDDIKNNGGNPKQPMEDSMN